MDIQSETNTSINYSALSKLRTTVGTLLEGKQQAYCAVGALTTFIVLVIIGFEWITAGTFVAGLCLAGLSWQYTKKKKLLDVYNSDVVRQFAQENDWNYVFSPAQAEQRPGVIFRAGHSKTVLDPISGNLCQLDFEAFNYRYTVGEGKNQTVNSVRIMEFTLPHSLPHMAIDSMIEEFGRFKSVMPNMFSNKNKMTLEGDFSKFFNVYALDGTAVTTLTLLAPDTMMVLLEKASKCDIEIIDNKLYFYWAESATDLKSYQEMFTVAETVLAKIGDKLLRADTALLSSKPVVMPTVANQTDTPQRLQPSVAGSLTASPKKSMLLMSTVSAFVFVGFFLMFSLFFVSAIKYPGNNYAPILFTLMSLWPGILTIIVSAFFIRKLWKNQKLKQDYDERYNRQ